MKDTQFKPVRKWGISISGNILVINAGKSDVNSDCRVNLSGRSGIGEFSETSRYRMRKYLRETETEFYSMLTLTYPPILGKSDAKACKDDLRVFIQRIRRDAESRNTDKQFSAFWFMEFQGSGSMHYHIFCTHGFKQEFIQHAWADCATKRMPENDKKDGMWNKIYQTGSRIERIRSGRHGVMSYASKYAAKFEQKHVPACFLESGAGRYWGVVRRGARLSAATDINADLEGISSVEYMREVIESRVMSHIARSEVENISHTMPEVPENVVILDVKDRETSRALQKYIQILEVIQVIVSGKDHARHMTDNAMWNAYQDIERRWPLMFRQLLKDKQAYAYRVHKQTE